MFSGLFWEIPCGTFLKPNPVQLWCGGCKMPWLLLCSVNGQGLRSATQLRLSFQHRSILKKKGGCNAQYAQESCLPLPRVEGLLMFIQYKAFNTPCSDRVANTAFPSCITVTSSISYQLCFPKDLRTSDCKKGRLLCSHRFTDACSR